MSEPAREPPAGAQEPPGGLVTGAIPWEPPGYQPRAALAAELDRAAAGWPALCSLTGAPGAGTTQVAAAYARARLAGGWRLVGWVSAAEPGRLLGGLAAIADAAGISDGRAKPGAVDRGTAVRRWLETDGDRCLLVFDEVADPEMVRPFLPAGGAAQVIMTGYRDPGLGTNIGVPAFSAEQARGFLAAHAGLADSEADEVAAALGRLPLPLALAAAVIARRRLEPGAYLEQLRASPPLAGQGESAPAAAQAVRLALAAAEDADQAGLCSAVLELVSVLSGAGVRRDLLHAAGSAGALGGRRASAAQVDAALKQAVGWSLLTVSVDGQQVLLNRLVARVIRDGLAGEQRLAQVCLTAAAVLEARAQALAGSPDRPAVRDVPGQVAALAAAAPAAPGTGEELTRALLRLRFIALYYLIELGDSATQAVAAGEALSADLERLLGPEHHDTLNARNSLAAAYQAAGRPAEAVTLFEQVLVARGRLLGPGHPDTLTTQNNLAAGYEAAGRADEAILLFERTLAAREQLLGPGHPSALISRGNLAAAYRDAGRADEAILLFEQTLAGRDQVLGPGHPDTVTSRVNLAAAYRAAGRITDAIPLLEQILATREARLGTGHPSTVAARNNLAAAYREAGRPDEAIPLFEQTAAACERLFGADHPRTLRAQTSLAACYQDAGRADEAVKLLEQALEARERVLGAGHRDTVSTRERLALAREAADSTLP